jgi:hypothetical protein
VLQKLTRERATENGATVGRPCQPRRVAKLKKSGEATKHGGK